MTMYAEIDENGFPVGFYSPELHGENIPAAAIQITDEQWLECINNNGFRRIVGGQVVVYEPPPVPVPVPIVSRRQFFQQAAIAGDITEEEAVAAVAMGAIPATMQAFIDAMPEGDRFGARMAIAGATEFDPAHPLSVGYAMATGRTPEQKDAFFRDAATL